METDLRLAELLATRLCHDISSPLNTVWGALEELDGTSDQRDDAIALASQAAEVLTRRLVLLRAAWGGPAEALDARGLTLLARGLPGRGVTLDLADLATGTVFAPALAQVMVNIVLLAAEALPRGGRVAIATVRPDELAVVVDGPRAAWPAGLAEAIADPAAIGARLAEASPRGMQALLTVLLATRAGVGLSFLLRAKAEPAPPLLLRRVE